MKRIVVFISLLYLFSILLFINLYLLDGIPHVPDSASYFFMGKMLASGTIHPSIPVDGAFVDFFPGLLNVSNDTWHFQYTYGHPLVLSIGFLIGFPQLIPPVIGALMILTLYITLKKLHDPMASYIILLLPFLSPFFLMNASSFMGHNTAAFYLSLSLLFLIAGIKREWNTGFFLSGICIGLLFNTRPLTAVPFAVSFFIFLLLITKSQKLKASILYACGGLCLLLVWCFFNYMVSGNMFQSSYYNQAQGFFFSDETIPQFFSSRFENFLILLKNFLATMYNLPPFLIIPLLLVPFLFRKDTMWDRFFLFNIFLLPLVYFFYNGTFLMYGPRFWYEITPFVFLLTARSLSILWHKNHLVTLVALILASIYALLCFTSIIPTKDPDMMSPLKLSTLKSFNSVDSRIITLVEKNNITNAVVFVKSCDINWWCYGSVFPQNNPGLTTDIVYVKDLGPKKNRELMTKYPFRNFYIADYEASTLKEYELY